MTPSVSVVEATSAEDVMAVQQLWTEYWQSLGLSLTFQNFAEELGTLPGKYAAPSGRLLLARVDEQPAGTIGLRRLRPDSCEAKRLYVHPAYRNRGLASLLLTRLIEEAQQAGYQHMYGDTLPSMASALDLYRKLGFIKVGPYSDDPTPGAIYLRLDL